MRIPFATAGAVVAFSVLGCSAEGDRRAEQAPRRDSTDQRAALADCSEPPVCRDGFAPIAPEVEACPPGTDSSICYSETAGGTTIGCFHVVKTCTAIAWCPDGFKHVESCTPGVACTQVTTCMETIWCEHVAVCVPPPACNDGDTQVASQSECTYGPAPCYRVAGGCDEQTVIWCTRPM